MSFGRIRRISAISGTGGPGCLADGRTQLLQADIVRAGEIARVRRQRGGLEIRLDAGHGFAEAGLDRPGQRALRADKAAGRDEELCHVDVERRLRGAERRGRQVDEHRPILADGSTLLRLSRPWEMPARVQLGDLAHQIEDGLVAHLVGLANSIGATSGWRVTMSASCPGPSAAITTSGTRTPA